MQDREERLLNFDFCRDYITKSPGPFLCLFLLGTLTYIPHVLKSSPAESGVLVLQGQRAKSCCCLVVVLWEQAVPRQDGVLQQPRGVFRSDADNVHCKG